MSVESGNGNGEVGWKFGVKIVGFAWAQSVGVPHFNFNIKKIHQNQPSTTATTTHLHHVL
jgi:hypothetical protein